LEQETRMKNILDAGPLIAALNGRELIPVVAPPIE
jgi:hypothetical protein